MPYAPPFANSRFAQSPLGNLLANRSNALLGAAASINPNARTLAGALQPAWGGAMQGRQIDTQAELMKQDQADRQRTLQESIAEKNLTIQTMRERGHNDLIPLAQSGRMSEAWEESQNRLNPGAGDQPGYGLTPLWGVDESGNPVIGQLSNQGGVQAVTPPEGVTFGRDPIRMDAGDRIILLDPVTRQPIGEVLKQGAPGTDMNASVDATGTRVVTPAPGSSESLRRQEEQESVSAAASSRAMYADIVTQDIDRLINAVEQNPAMATGPGAAASQGIPGTPAFNARQLADTIRANVGFDRLQQMRDASPTGGALGQVSELENRLMQATLGNLELSQSQDQLLYNLRRIRDIYTRIVNEGISDPEAQNMLTDRQPQQSNDGFRVIGVE